MANGKRCTQALPLLQTHLFTLLSRAAEAVARCRIMPSIVDPSMVTKTLHQHVVVRNKGILRWLQDSDQIIDVDGMGEQ